MPKVFYLVFALLLTGFYLVNPVLAQEGGKPDEFTPPGLSKKTTQDTAVVSQSSVVAPITSRSWGTIPAIGDLYFKADDNVVVASEIAGDAYLAGNRVEIPGHIRGDALIAAGEVTVDGLVDQDLRVVAGKVLINGEVGRNVTVAGGQVEVSDKARILGNLAVVGGQVEVSNQASIAGRTYIHSAPKEGKTPKFESPFNVMSKAMSILALTLSALSWVSTLLMGLLLLVLFPKSVKRVLLTAEKNMGRSLIWGMVASITVPVLALLALFTILGIPLGIILLVGLGVAWYVAKLSAMIYAGAFIMTRVKTPRIRLIEKTPNLYLSFLLGWGVFLLLSLIPFLGWAVKLLLTWTSLGALLQKEWDCYRENEQK